MMTRLGADRGKGQALVEFALIIPIFLFVVLGLFDMGRAVLYYSTISNASREAVRVAIVDQDPADIRQEAVDSAAAVMRVAPGDVDIAHLNPNLTAGGVCSTAPYEIGCVVRVRITHSFVPATPFIPQLTLGAETHQQIERRYTSP